ncbi:ribonuclease P protein subunit p29-like isoform X2 [Lutra lutra]|nr:ribonuclease P protein subunit p29-like isoform X2 [Lutra lutra]
MSQQAREDQLQRKAVVLEYVTRRKHKEKRKKSKGLSARQRRKLHLFDIKPEQQRYSLFLPLHELWKQYIRDLCGGLKPDTQPHMIQTKLLKADLQGALVSVTKSKCPSYVGVTGILLQETKHVLKILTKEDHLKGTELSQGVWPVASPASSALSSWLQWVHLASQVSTDCRSLLAVRPMPAESAPALTALPRASGAQPAAAARWDWRQRYWAALPDTRVRFHD